MTGPYRPGYNTDGCSGQYIDKIFFGRGRFGVEIIKISLAHIAGNIYHDCLAIAQ